MVAVFMFAVTAVGGLYFGIGPAVFGATEPATGAHAIGSFRWHEIFLIIFATALVAGVMCGITLYFRRKRLTVRQMLQDKPQQFDSLLSLKSNANVCIAKAQRLLKNAIFQAKQCTECPTDTAMKLRAMETMAQCNEAICNAHLAVNAYSLAKVKV